MVNARGQVEELALAQRPLRADVRRCAKGAAGHREEVAAGGQQYGRNGNAGEQRYVRHADNAGVELSAAVIRNVAIDEEPQLLVYRCVVAPADVERLLRPIAVRIEEALCIA